MPRYRNNITITKTSSGKRYYTSALPSDPASASDYQFIHTARMGDRWDTLAYKYLGAANLWYVIANANSQLNGSIFIKPGTLVIIPEVV